MGKYRKKPTVIEAVQFNAPPDFNVDITGVLFHENCGDERSGCSLDGRCYVETLEGRLAVSNGDWIITGVKGEIYPFFETTYEKVEDDE